MYACYAMLSHFSRVRSVWPHRRQPPGSPVPGILQARTLEWVAISFSNAWKWKVKGKSLSRVRLLATPWTAAHQAPPSMGFSRQKYWSGVPLPSPNVCIRIKQILRTNVWCHRVVFMKCIAKENIKTLSWLKDVEMNTVIEHLWDKHRGDFPLHHNCCGFPDGVGDKEPACQIGRASCRERVFSRV